MRITFIYLFNLGGNHFEDTTDHTKIPQMCLIEAGDESDVQSMTKFIAKRQKTALCLTPQAI